MDDEVVFGFADEDLEGTLAKLDAEGVDTKELLSSVAAMDPDKLMYAHRAVAYKAARIQAAADKECDRIQSIAARKVEGLKGRLGFLEAVLTNAVQKLVELSKGKVKTLATPYGSISVRQKPLSLVIESEGNLIDRLLQDDTPKDEAALVTQSVVFELDKATLKAQLKAGRTIEGARLERGPDSYNIEHVWEGNNG